MLGGKQMQIINLDIADSSQIDQRKNQVLSVGRTSVGTQLFNRMTCIKFFVPLFIFFYLKAHECWCMYDWPLNIQNALEHPKDTSMERGREREYEILMRIAYRKLSRMKCLHQTSNQNALRCDAI